MADNEDVKAWLSRFAENERELDTVLERIKTMRSSIEAPKSTKFSGMPHASGYEVDTIGRVLAQVEALEDVAKGLLAKSRNLYAEINSAIARISGKDWPNRRAVLRMRYLDLAEWGEVVLMLWGRKPDFDDREESYLRRTFRIHGEALEALSNIVPDFQETGNITESEETGK